MKKTLMTALIASFGLLASQAFAANADCDAKAAEKKLAGAAKSSFLKKCEKDTTATSPACDQAAADKKLAGAAKKSFLKKCVADAAAK